MFISFIKFFVSNINNLNLIKPLEKEDSKRMGVPLFYAWLKKRYPFIKKEGSENLPYIGKILTQNR